MTTVFQLEGYHDSYNFDQNMLLKSPNTIQGRRNQGTLIDGKRIYDFIFVPNSGFLNSNLPLLSDCELKLSFDRANASVALLHDSTTVDPSWDLKGKNIEITDCYAITEYISSDYYRHYFDRIDNEPIHYQFEECDVTLKSLPTNQFDIRLDNIRGGNSPTYLFVGVLPTDAFSGSFEQSSVGFRSFNVQKINITLNGRTVNGYPIEMPNESIVTPFQKFYDVTNRHMNPLAGECMSLNKFKTNWIYAHNFEAEMTSQGWIGVHLELSTLFDKPHTLVLWSVYTTAISIDKFRQIEKNIL